MVDFLLLAASLACVYGLFSASDTLANASGLYSRLEVALAICQIFLALIIGYKALGKALPLIAIVFLLYTLYGNKIPGMFKTAKVSLSRLAPYLLVGSEGMFGTALVTCSRFIFIFIFFGAVLDLIGAGSFFVDLAFSLTGRAKGGAAQASIYSSGGGGLRRRSDYAPGDGLGGLYYERGHRHRLRADRPGGPGARGTLLPHPFQLGAGVLLEIQRLGGGYGN